MSDKTVMDRVRALVATLGTREKAARRLGVSVAYLGELLRGTRTPGPKVLAALGMRKETSYVEDTDNAKM